MTSAAGFWRGAAFVGARWGEGGGGRAVEMYDNSVHPPDRFGRVAAQLCT